MELNQKFQDFSKLIKENVPVNLIVIIACAVMFAAEKSMGRLIFGPDGKFGFYSWDIWSNEQSQRLIDPYSLSHITHGLLFYAILWLLLPKVPIKYRFMIAVGIEAIWEIMENSSFIINRYRAVTVSLGYFGDSIINSISDLFMMIIGFVLASKSRVWISIAFVITLEIIMLIWVKDNLSLNIIMLLFPIEAIKNWQMAGHV